MTKIFLKKEDIYSMALDKLEQGDYVTGINLLYRSAPFDSEKRTDLAIAYYNIGQYAYALKELFIVFSDIGDDYEIIKNIIRCFIEIGQTESALYYIKYCLDRGIFDDEDLEFEDFEIDTENAIGVLDNRDKSQEIQLAHKLIFAEQYDYAEELLKSIDKNSYQYYDSRNFLAMLSLAEDKPDQALKYCDEVLSGDPDNVMALSQKFTAFHMKGQLEKRDEIIEILKEIKTSEVTDFAKMAVNYKLIGDDAMTMECFEKIIKQLPYDRDYLVCAAQACFNCGYTERARNIIVDALHLFPFDATVQYYAREISTCKKTNKFEILPVIPAAQAAIWFADLDKLTGLSFTAAERAIRADKDLDLKIRWAFQNDFTAIQIALIRLLIKSNRYKKYFSEFLLDPFGNLRVKREILSLYMANYPDFIMLALTVEEKFKKVKPNIPYAIRHHKLFPAYCKVFSMLIMTNEKFVAKLNRAFKEIMQSDERISISSNFNALGAVLLNKLMGNHLTEEKCCENMECDMTDFKVFKELIYGKNN